VKQKVPDKEATKQIRKKIKKGKQENQARKTVTMLIATKRQT
jgi:hypothetical protein